MSREAPDWWKLQYFNRVKDLIDQHQPDLLYTDGGIPFEQYGLGTVAEVYNAAARNLRDHTEGVYFSKSVEDCAIGTCILDRERGVSQEIWPAPWQTDTCIGQWHYNVGETYKTPKKVIDLLVDIVSKNGNLLLNIPLPASGLPDDRELAVLAGITQWMSINGEGIYATRPWKINGEGPSMQVKVAQAGFNEGKQPDLGPSDIRFTTKGKSLYAFVQGWPTQSELIIQSLATNSPHQADKALDVRLLGRDEPLKFTQDTTGLRVTFPTTKPLAADIGVTLRINFI